jgi:hypothetical protein
MSTAADDTPLIGLPISAIGDFREQQKHHPMWPYEVLASSDRWVKRTQRVADEIVDGTWSFKRYPAISVRPPVAWDEAAASHRSWHFHLHAWDHLGPVLAAHERTRDHKYLRFATLTALDWAETFPSLDTPSPFAWYDMAIGVRAYRLAYVLDSVARDLAVPDDVVGTLVDAVAVHLLALADDDRFAVHSNHGLYFAAGQAAIARRFPTLPGAEAARRQARERLLRLIETQFAADGVHKEHSPDYHRMLLDTLFGLVAAQLIEGEDFELLVDRIQEALAWFVMPNGRLVMFGDTTHHLMTAMAWEHFPNAALRFVMSGGTAGRPPDWPIRAFPDGGYVVMRDRWPDGAEDYASCSYLAQTCAFHSRQHRHADDLSFVWYDRGHEILTDAGRFGYLDPAPKDSPLRKEGFWYANPNRIYVESTLSHNTVEIDGRSLPRANVTPYGSALRASGRANGVSYSDAHVVHWDTISHRRTLVLEPGRWLLVLDRLHDTEKEKHAFVQRFHFAPELTVAAGDVEGAFDVTHDNDPRARLQVAPLLPVRAEPPVKGRQRPLLGWASRQEGTMEPVWTIAYRADKVAAHEFATVFAFGSDVPELVSAPEPGKFVFTVGRRELTVVLERNEGDELRAVRVTRRWQDA